MHEIVCYPRKCSLLKLVLLLHRDETLFTGLENFTNNAPVNDIPDGQDGYGMMISELLESDLPNCSSVPPGINSLQNEMGLNNGEVTPKPLEFV